MSTKKPYKSLEEALNADWKDVYEKQSRQWQTSQFESGCHGDMIIQCGHKKWSVHQIIVCAQSPFFEKACEKNFIEGFSGVINLPDDDPDMIYVMLRFMYARDYSDGSEIIEPRKACENPALAFNATMYGLADKYDVKILKVLAQNKFAAALLKFNANHFQDLVKAIEIIYTTTLSSDRGLRDCLKPILQEWRYDLYHHSPPFLDLFKSGIADGDFTMDTVNAWIDFSHGVKAYYCTRCCTEPSENNDYIACMKCGIMTSVKDTQ